jgi:drug/metabolite transporter (DMT)-like permease
MRPELSKSVAPIPTVPQPPRVATLALVLATMSWAGSFTWAKAAGDGINQAAGLPSGALFGPILLLAWRFSTAGVLWLALFPEARRGWTRKSFQRTLLLGLALWAGQTVQMLGLDRTSEAVNAFLTSLTVIFVPLLMVLAVRRPPPAAIWLPVGVAALGIWLMTGAAPTGFGVGEVLGLSCALIFSAHMIALGEMARQESPWRMAAGQFLVVGVASALSCLVVASDPAALALQEQWATLTRDGMWMNIALLIVFSTMIAFGLMFTFQPKLDPTRAALVYLAEPIFAALFAYVAVGRGLSPIALWGAIMILAANALVELIEWRQRRQALRAARATANVRAAEMKTSATRIRLQPCANRRGMSDLAD